MPSFREKMRLLKAICVFVSNKLTPLWPAVQQEVVHQAAVEVQRQVVVEVANQVSVFCWQTMFQFMYNYPILTTILTTFTTIATTLEYFTGVVSEGCVFFWCFGYELCVWVKDIMYFTRQANEWLELTPKEWVVIFIVLVSFAFLIPIIFRIWDAFTSDDKPQEEPRKKRARGKSPRRKTE